jgi:hypothetical protein
VKALGVIAAAVVVLAAGCGGTKHTGAGKTCPQAWRHGWQRLADRVKAPVFCPTVMPDPLTGDTTGPFRNGVSVDPDRSYLVSFVAVLNPPEFVQVNFRGYPGRTSIPSCTEGKRAVPCFSHPAGHRHANGLDATVYTTAQDADANHIAYVWKDKGALYSVSELVGEPYGRSQVLRNLDAVLKNLARVKPV